MKLNNEPPDSGPFIIVWEFRGQLFSDSFRITDPEGRYAEMLKSKNSEEEEVWETAVLEQHLNFLPEVNGPWFVYETKECKMKKLLTGETNGSK
jgi:hypothetical protein